MFQDCCSFLFFGAVDGGRTRDLRLGKPPLCQLSYYRIFLYVEPDMQDVAILNHIVFAFYK